MKFGQAVSKKVLGLLGNPDASDLVITHLKTGKGGH